MRKRWGVLFQGGALFSTLTVAENVQVPLREFYPNLDQGLLDAIAAYKVVMTGLAPEAGPKHPSALSGGMRQRAALARAPRSEEHRTERQLPMRQPYDDECLTIKPHNHA